MHTPDGTLRRGEGACPYTDPGHVATPEDVDPPPAYHLFSWPGDSLVRLQDELVDNKVTDSKLNLPSVCQDSSPDTPQYDYDFQQGWINGIFGCLRPVLSIIGKGADQKKTDQDGWEIPFEHISHLTFIESGGQGSVFVGNWNNQQVAVKKVSELKDTDIRNLRKLNHPNIVKFKGVCTQKPCFCIVMEFCPYGSLFNILKNGKQRVTVKRTVSWAKQIASGMNYLHSQKIIHRDLKSPNVLVGEDEVIKISDFGTSKTWNGVSQKMTFAGTVAWMAPEAIQELNCSEKIDVWSFGIVLWELLTCQVPYDGLEQSAIMYSVGMGKLTPPIPSTCPDGYKLIMQMCWKRNPKERPSFKLLCNHLEIASVEMLDTYEDNQFFKTQENWKQEIRGQITLFVEQSKKFQFENHFKEEQYRQKREMEMKDIEDFRELYKKKIEKLNELYLQLKVKLEQLDRVPVRKRKLQPGIFKKIERKRSQSTTPTSPDCSLTSPDSPQKGLRYSQAQTCCRMTQTNSSCRKRQYRNSASPRSSCCSRKEMVNAETQTDSMDVSENDISPASSTSTVFPQRVILQEFPSQDDDEGNGNTVHLHFPSHPQNKVQVFTRVDSRSPSPVDFRMADSVNKNIAPPSDEDTLETIERRVTAVVENGNYPNNETRNDQDYSCSEEEEEAYSYSLRRKTFARRPIYPGRRSRSRSSTSCFKKDPVSDEGNTSEYSPSSRTSTLESNPDVVKAIAKMSLKRSAHSDDSSESDSEENLSVQTQIPFEVEGFAKV